MTEVKINITELKSEGEDLIKELATYLKEKTAIEPNIGADSITLGSEEKNVSKQYLRVLLRKFLHKVELKDYFKVISGQENSLMVKERKIAEEE